MRVYIDRSGSMTRQDDVLEAMLEEADKYPDAELYGFDNTVWPITTTEDLDRIGGGTYLPLAHIGDAEAIVLTDGLISPMGPDGHPTVIPPNVQVIAFVPAEDIPFGKYFAGLEVRAVGHRVDHTIQHAR